MKSIWIILASISLAACAVDSTKNQTQTTSPPENSPQISSTAQGVQALTVNGLTACTDHAANFSATTGNAVTGNQWLYQLQDADINAILGTQFDIVTMDYSFYGDEESRYSASELASLENAGKTALAYLSIGEAEDYRYYFDSTWVETTGNHQPSALAPCWLGQTNPDWQGNYKTRYWSNEWQETVLGYLDKIIDAGFDGAYLDIVDGFEYWSTSGNGEGLVLSEEEAATRMINFVKRIAHHARVTRGKTNFFIVPQNAEYIFDFDYDDSYATTISGMGIEDLFYDETYEQDSEITDERLYFIGKFTPTNKPVLVADYVDNANGYTGSNQIRIDDFRSKVLSKGYLPYAALADRELNIINSIPGLQE